VHCKELSREPSCAQHPHGHCEYSTHWENDTMLKVFYRNEMLCCLHIEQTICWLCVSGWFLLYSNMLRYDDVYVFEITNMKEWFEICFIVFWCLLRLELKLCFNACRGWDLNYANCKVKVWYLSMENSNKQDRGSRPLAINKTKVQGPWQTQNGK